MSRTRAENAAASVAYVYTEQPDYVRANKVLRTLSDNGFSVTYYGCLRGEDTRRNPPDLSGVRYVMSGVKIPHGGMRSLIPTLYFIAWVWLKMLWSKPDYIIAVNEELALPFILAGRSRHTKVICEVLDSIKIRLPTRGRAATRFLTLLSDFTLRRVDGVIEVSEARTRFHPHGLRLVEIVCNSPRRNTGPHLAADTHLPSPYVFVSGSFSAQVNGLETLLQAVSLLRGRLSIIAAGRPTSTWVRETFLCNKCVTFLGTLNPAEADRLAENSLGVFAYYKPVSPNYIYAAPNKLFDAMKAGVPIIMNTECAARELAVRHGFWTGGAYHDAQALAQELENLLDRPPQEVFRSRLRGVFNSTYCWETQEHRLLNVIRNA